MKCKTLLLPLLAGLVLCAPNTYARNPEVNIPANLASKSLSFTENKGQIINQFQQPRPDIDFRLSAGNGLSVFVGSGQIHYQWAKSVKGGHEPLLRMEGHVLGAGSRQESDTPTFKMYRMDVTLLGANPDAQVITEGQQAAFERYFQPWVNKDNSNNGVVAHSYRKITYKNVYPNIDWVLYIKGNTVEYDFVVHPGGKVSDIRLQYGGATKLALQANGSLLATTPMGKVREQAPHSYDAQGRVVASAFQLEGNTLSFKTDTYQGTLTIDPTVEWGTYFGDLGQDIAYGVKSDANENIYMTGITASTDNIATTGAYQTTYAGGTYDAFIAGFKADGDISWATYFGGDAEDRGTDIALNPVTNNIFIAGVTKSTSGIATANTHQDTLGGNWDAFLAGFDTTGSLVWSTYFGGEGSEGTGLIAGVTCNKAGYIFLSGETSSDSGIATAGAYQTSRAGGVDAFLAKFDTAGQIQWSTYFGGDGNEYGRKLGCDTAGNIYLGGYTSSTSGIASTSAFQSSFGGVNDAFLAKFNTNGGREWSTYFGGAGSEVFNAIAVAEDGTSYIGGSTTSDVGIATGSVFQTEKGGAADGYVASFTETGQQNWASYIGGSGADVVNALAVNNQELFVGGMSNSSDSISFGNSFQQSFSGILDGVVIKLDILGHGIWGTYFGGSGSEFVNALAITPDERLYLAGQTASAANIATTGSYQENYGGGAYDAFLAKFNVCEPPVAPVAILGDTLVCSGTPAEFSVAPVAGATSYTWLLPSGWSGNSDSAAISITPDNSNGVIYVLANSCAASDSTSLAITVLPSPEPQLVQNGNILSTTQAYDSYQWNLNGQPVNGATGAIYLMVAAGSYSVTVTTAEGCSGISDTIAYTTGINVTSALKAAIKVSPNPATDRINIQSPVPVDIKLNSIDGRELLRQENATSINIGGLSNGLYLLHIYGQKGALLKVEKVIKKGE